jgi:hypothetical protein
MLRGFPCILWITNQLPTPLEVLTATTVPASIPCVATPLSGVPTFASQPMAIKKKAAAPKGAPPLVFGSKGLVLLSG